jgi:hypothetical protein
VLGLLNRKVRAGDPWAIVADERHGLRWERNFYVRPGAQVAELRELGFRDPLVYDSKGKIVPDDELARLTQTPRQSRSVMYAPSPSRNPSRSIASAC